jgi:chorismate synthase
LKLDLSHIQAQVNHRKTGNQKYASARTEEDKVEIISGMMNGQTMGTPLAILIANKDARPQDYEALKDVYRPSHSDYTLQKKYGIRDHRGGGRSSIRVTAPIVAAGAIAEQICMLHGIEIISYVKNIGGKEITSEHIPSQEEIYDQEFRMLHESNEVNSLLDQLIQSKDTVGGSIHTIVKNLPIGLGGPIFNKFNSALSHAIMSINTVKMIEFGHVNLAEKGSEHNDEWIAKEGKITTLTNHDAGIQGGITNGNILDFTAFFKPISSIGKLQHTINEKGDNIALEIQGRHDVCAVPRAIPIVRAYTSIILADFILQKQLDQI